MSRRTTRKLSRTIANSGYASFALCCYTNLLSIQALLPFAIIGSEEEIEIDGQPVRARIYPWGIAEVDNPKHSDFSRLRSALLKYVILSCLVFRSIDSIGNLALIWVTWSPWLTMFSMKHTVPKNSLGLFIPILSMWIRFWTCAQLIGVQWLLHTPGGTRQSERASQGRTAPPRGREGMRSLFGMQPTLLMSINVASWDWTQSATWDKWKTSGVVGERRIA